MVSVGVRLPFQGVLGDFCLKRLYLSPQRQGMPVRRWRKRTLAPVNSFTQKSDRCTVTPLRD
jgi:hypothetical protein